MVPFLSVKVILSRKAYSQIKYHLINAKNDYETGGILIGYKIGQVYFVIAVTAPNKIVDKSNISFVLEGKQHTKQVLKIMRRSLWYKPSILGVWHSHICDDVVFSEQDRISNQECAKFFNGALSMITKLPVSSQELKLNTYFITNKGCELHCHTYSWFV